MRVVPMRRTTMPWMRACVARPMTVVPMSRAPTAARACTVRRSPTGETTSSEPCCFATTIPLKPDAPAAAGQKAATAPARATRMTIPFFMTLLQLVPAPAQTGFQRRGEGAEKLAADLRRPDEAAELLLEPDEEGLERKWGRELQLLRVPP